MRLLLASLLLIGCGHGHTSPTKQIAVVHKRNEGETMTIEECNELQAKLEQGLEDARPLMAELAARREAEEMYCDLCDTPVDNNSVVNFKYRDNSDYCGLCEYCAEQAEMNGSGGRSL